MQSLWPLSWLAIAVITALVAAAVPGVKKYTADLDPACDNVERMPSSNRVMGSLDAYEDGGDYNNDEYGSYNQGVAEEASNYDTANAHPEGEETAADAASSNGEALGRGQAEGKDGKNGAESGKGKKTSPGNAGRNRNKEDGGGDSKGRTGKNKPKPSKAKKRASSNGAAASATTAAAEQPEGEGEGGGAKGEPEAEPATSSRPGQPNRAAAGGEDNKYLVPAEDAAGGAAGDRPAGGGTGGAAGAVGGGAGKEGGMIQGKPQEPKNGGSGEETKHLKGYHVFKTEELRSRSHLLALKVLRKAVPDIFFFRHPTLGRSAKIMVDKKGSGFLKKFLEFQDIQFKKETDDMEKYILELSNLKGGDDDVSNRAFTPNRGSRNYTLDWNDYHGYDDICKFLQAEARANPDFVKVGYIGNSHERRPIKVLGIKKAGPGKPNVLVEGGTHAREWISPAVTTFIIRELLEGQGVPYLSKLNFHFVPVTNPDGYEFSRSSVDNRLWRKNRRPVSQGCVGTDLNRNFDFKFGTLDAPKDPCEETYPGEAAFSEPETRHLRDLYNSLQPLPILFFSLHSAHDKLLFSYGHSKDAFPKNKEELISLCNASIAALNLVHNQVFECIHSTDMYETSGSAMDYFVSRGTRFAYTVELRDNGYEFLLPPKLIIPSGQEMWAGFKTMLDKVLEVTATAAGAAKGGKGGGSQKKEG